MSVGVMDWDRPETENTLLVSGMRSLACSSGCGQLLYLGSLQELGSVAFPDSSPELQSTFLGSGALLCHQGA